MTKPDDIPQDVWDAAQKVEADINHDDPSAYSVRAIARAILAERTRCANQVFHVAKHVKATK